MRTERRERGTRLDTLAGGQKAAFGKDVGMEWKRREAEAEGESGREGYGTRNKKT